MSMIDRAEGARYALSILEASAKTPPAIYDERGPVNTILDNLEQTAKSKPAAFAEGIMGVVKICREQLREA